MNHCGRCGAEFVRGKRNGYCSTCHAANMREWRKSHPLTVEQRKRDSARSYLSVYIKRGKIAREPCRVCGIEPAEGHHHRGYDSPLDVVWLCRTHHLEEHPTIRGDVTLQS